MVGGVGKVVAIVGMMNEVIECCLDSCGRFELRVCW